MTETNGTVRLTLAEPYQENWIEIRDPQELEWGEVKRIQMLIQAMRGAASSGDADQAMSRLGEFEAAVQGLIIGWNLTRKRTGDPLDPKQPGIFDSLTVSQYEAVGAAIQEALSGGGASKNSGNG